MAQTYVTLLALLLLCLFCPKNISFTSKFNTSTDESSLLAIKAHITSDPNNYLTTNWSSGTSFCSWTGVTCSRRRARVVALDLLNMSLYGTIAPHIGNLSFMRFIDLSNNTFTGTIPDEIGNLRRLSSLYMSFNRLSGSIPWSIFNLSSLREIRFKSNMLCGTLPPNICRHPAAKLKKLGLPFNQLVGEIPRGLSQCADLEILSLSFNNFSGSLPVDIGNLSKLQILYLGRNHLTERLESMIDVASAIEYLHHGYSSSVGHCDLKPSNILLDEDMVAHVANFGISKLLTEDQRMEQTKTLGIIGYMAPEYGSAGLVSTKVDVYSFGILLMETFTKKKPTDEMFLGDLTMREWVSDLLA